jgi:hypothetical protein
MIELNSVEKQFSLSGISRDNPFLDICILWFMANLPYQTSVPKFQLQEPIKTQDPVRTGLLLSIAKGQTDVIQN